MSRITSKTKDEPVVTAAVIQSLVAALLAAGAAFGLGLTPEQIAAITTVVAIVAPFIAAWWARQRVTPVR